MKYIIDLTVRSVENLSPKHVLIKLTDHQPLPEMLPGQFVEVRVDGSPATFLRRPISIHFVDKVHNELWLMVAMIGDGTRQMGRLQAGDTLNCVLPLGNAFTMPAAKDEKVLLVGGGVGVAPMLYLGSALHAQGIQPTFLLGGRTAQDLLELDIFNRYGRVCVTTEDGSLGEKGFVTNHSVLNEHFDRICTCGYRTFLDKPFVCKSIKKFCRHPYSRLYVCLLEFVTLYKFGYPVVYLRHIIKLLLRKRLIAFFYT